MKMIFGSFVIGAILAIASATKKGDDSLLSVLSKERQEMKELFRHDNKQLREQDTKLQQEDDQLRKMNKQLQEQIVKMREEKLKEENNMMKKENSKLQDENALLKKEIKKLRHADRRQRRQEDDALETKKRESQTNNTLTMREAISEVEITGGSADATSFYGERYKPKNAFIRDGNSRSPWDSGIDPKNKGVFPQMVWYDFGYGNAFVPARVSFRGRTDCETCQTQTPSVWEFVGSNDDVCTGSGNWTVLCQDLSDVVPQKQLETKFCDINNSNPSVEQREYRCLGINVIRARQIYTSLSNVRMWKNVVQKGGMKDATQFE